MESPIEGSDEEAKVRILVIDDYRPHGESLRELLETFGHEALYAESFASARKHLDVARFHLAFLDFDMPALRGPAAATIIAERFPETRTVILSAHALTRERRIELGDRPFLEKPVSLSALLECIAAVERGIVGRALALPPVRALAPYQSLRLEVAPRPGQGEGPPRAQREPGEAEER